MARLAVLAVFALLAVIANAQGSTDQTTTCYDCPSGYIKQESYNPDGCAYTCVSPAKLNCLYPLSNPIICGGDTYKPCPTISCGYTAAYAVSGPAGCSQARSRVDATAISKTSYNLIQYFYEPYFDICTDMSDGIMSVGGAVGQAAGDIPYTNTGSFTDVLKAKSVAAAEAYSEALATTFINYNAYVCGCCSGNSAAYASVGVDVVAVASASSQAYAAALAMVTDCYGNIRAGASQISTAFASDVQLAIDGVYKTIVAKTYTGKCDAIAVYNQIKYALARAAVCVFAEAYAEAANDYYANNGITGYSYNCGTALAISGTGGSWSQTCYVAYDGCPSAQ